MATMTTKEKSLEASQERRLGVDRRNPVKTRIVIVDGHGSNEHLCEFLQRASLF